MERKQTIPVLNLQEFEDPSTRPGFVKKIGDALKDVGFFALEDHGVNQGLIKEAYGLAQAFFELPGETKEKYENKEVGQRGFISFGREHAKGQKAPDLKEFWHVGRELPTNHPMLSKFGTNVWPEEVPAFRGIMTNLYQQIDDLSMKLLKAISLYLEMEEDELPSGAADGDTIFRLIHYPPMPEDRDPESVRAAEHEDINLITILCESTAEGLELLQRDGSWLPVHALEGQLIVDSGDMMQNLSNGLLRATTHRVVNPDNDRSRRFSMPFFVHPRGEYDLSPRSHLVDKTGGEKKFVDMTAGAYLDQRLEEIGLM